MPPRTPRTSCGFSTRTRTKPVPGGWEFGAPVNTEGLGLLPPVRPGKIVGVGRSYRDHAKELDNPVPEEPVLFLKAPSSITGPRSPVVLPPESERVDYEGEIAVVLGSRLRRATEEQARVAILGITCACDVTARDLQRRDATFARAKSFDTFCPIGPGVRVDGDLATLEVRTRINGEERQYGRAEEMLWPIPQLLAYISSNMTLEPGDVVLTGTPSGVGPLEDGDEIEIEIPGVGCLTNNVEAWRRH